MRIPKIKKEIRVRKSIIDKIIKGFKIRKWKIRDFK
jgi:hypothetical protein